MVLSFNKKFICCSKIKRLILMEGDQTMSLITLQMISSRLPLLILTLTNNNHQILIIAVAIILILILTPLYKLITK